MTTYLRPATLDQALSFVARSPARILAGGTDLYPATRQPQLDGSVLDLTAIKELKGISSDQTSMRIGACTTWAEIANAPLPPALHALQQAAREVGGRQIQNSGTIGGNLCNASPAADGVPPLLAVDAEVELVSLYGTRVMPLSAFLKGPRQTELRQGEMMAAILVRNESLKGQSCFLKLGARAYLVISIAMVAVRLTFSQGTVASARLAVGACSASARRLPTLESRLEGSSIADAVALIDQVAVAAALSPVDDLRATATYRTEAATELLKRGVAEITKVAA